MDRTGPDGVPDLWIAAVGRDSRQRLTETSTAEVSPAWSPNGRDIAFIRVGHGVFIVPALGGPERRVSDSGSMVAWMPDGRSLLITDGELAAGTPHGIFQIDLETLTRTQVTRAPSGIRRLGVRRFTRRKFAGIRPIRAAGRRRCLRRADSRRRSSPSHELER